MEATKILMEEHRVIERVLAAMEIASHRLVSGESIRERFFLDVADFIRGFADGRHHRKEEGVLFPAMESAGVLKVGGPIGVMLAEHEEGRRLARAMRAAAERLQAGETLAKEAIAANARGYVALLRQHIAKEDNVLFPMADRVIPTADQLGLIEAFERVEQEATGESAYKELTALAETLERDAYA